MMNNNCKIKEFFNKIASGWDEYSYENHELIEKYIAMLDINENSKVLDVACGTGVITNVLKETNANHVTAIDISDKMIEIAKSKIYAPNVEFVASDFLTSDISGYDSVIVYNALPHFADRKQLANKIHSSLKIGGIALICHGISKDKINSCHKNVMDISSHLHSPKEEFENFKDGFELICESDNENEYYFLIKKVN